jgi:hypothetical protein
VCGGRPCQPRPRGRDVTWAAQRRRRSAGAHLTETGARLSPPSRSAHGLILYHRIAGQPHAAHHDVVARSSGEVVAVDSRSRGGRPSHRAGTGCASLRLEEVATNSSVSASLVAAEPGLELFLPGTLATSQSPLLPLLLYMRCCLRKSRRLSPRYRRRIPDSRLHSRSRRRRWGASSHQWPGQLPLRFSSLSIVP